MDIHHEPDATTCTCGCQLKRIGQDVSEKLDYTPGVFTVAQSIIFVAADAFKEWMLLQRQKITDGSTTAKALDYSLKRWGALTQFLDDGQLPIDNNWIENQIRPITIGRNNWLFAGSLRAGQRAAAVMSLIQSAKLNGHDPYASTGPGAAH